MRSPASWHFSWKGGAWLLGATLALLVAVAVAAAVGSAAWIANSGDEAREIEDRGMLMMAFSEQRALFSEAAARAAQDIAALGPNAAGPVERRISEILAPAPFSALQHRSAYLLRDAEVVASYPDGIVRKGDRIDPVIASLIPLLATDTVHAGADHSRQPSVMPHSMAMADMPRPMIAALGVHVGVGGAEHCTSFLRIEGNLYEMAVARVSEGRNTPGSSALTGLTVVLLANIDGSMIARMSQQHRVADLTAGTARPPTERASLALSDATGATAGYLSWVRAKPVSTAFGEAMPFFAVLAFALCSLAALAGVQSYRSNKRLVEQERTARYEADHDALTGLLNRTAFVEAMDLRLAEAPDAPLCILYLDLDGFKEINDTLGHHTGDELLVCVAERIRASIGRHGLLARLGGDEFALMFGAVTAARAQAAGTEISKAVHRTIPMQGKSLTMNISIGIACAPGHGRDSQELLRRADIALYAAKKLGRGQVALFDTTMEEAIRHRQLVELDLRAALGTDQLYLAYQLIVASDGSRPLGVEALLRWNHPQRGLIPPSDFIPIAEETGFIRALGVWVLQEACRTVRNWPGLTVAVNISPVQMRSRDIVNTVAGVLAETGLEAGRLVLEITEGVLIEHQDEATSIVQALQALGVRIALDDFGTGYSSLAYLKRFPFDKLKIDKSFVDTLGQRADDATIVHAIISLGRALGMSVIAEGVETTEQHRFLRAAGCHEFQGYLFAKPVMASEIDRLLRRPGNANEAHRLYPPDLVSDERQSVANVA